MIWMLFVQIDSEYDSEKWHFIRFSFFIRFDYILFIFRNYRHLWSIRLHSKSKTYVHRAHMKLTIKNLQYGDFGNYRCISKNSLGETEGSIRVYGKSHQTKFFFFFYLLDDYFHFCARSSSSFLFFFCVLKTFVFYFACLPSQFNILFVALILNTLLIFSIFFFFSFHSRQLLQ